MFKRLIGKSSRAGEVEGENGQWIQIMDDG